ITLKTQTYIRQLSPQRPTASFQSGRKERTQRSPARGPSAPPSDLREDLRLARGLQSRPSTAPRVSALLEGSEPTLGEAKSSPSPSRPPLDRKDKRPFRSPAHRTEALNSNHSSVASGSDGVRQPLRVVAVTEVPSANSGYCSAIPDAVATLWEPATQCKTCSALLQPLYCQFPMLLRTFPSAEPSNGMGTTLGSGSGLDQDKTLACRTLGTPPRHAWRTVPPTATTTPPAGAARTPVR